MNGIVINDGVTLTATIGTDFIFGVIFLVLFKLFTGGARVRDLNFGFAKVCMFASMGLILGPIVALYEYRDKVFGKKDTGT